MANMNSDDQITLSLPANLLAQIDAQVGANFTDRQDFIRSAVRDYLMDMQERTNMYSQQ